MADELIEVKRDYIYMLAEKGKRIDGRKFDEFRQLKITTGIIAPADGSAKVELGDTQVIVGVKILPGTPFPDTPNLGVLTSNAEMGQIASPDFEGGPPSPESIELARVVDRGIRESKAIDMEKLCIVAGEKCWMVFIDIHVIDFSGNLIDCAGISALAALKNAKVPAKKHGLGEDFPLPINHFPVPITHVRIGKYVMADPLLEEEDASHVRLTITTDENGDVRAMQKGGTGALTRETINMMFEEAVRLGKKIRTMIP
ncbi:MAG: exosome complex protein Rrp42 [Thermoplasmata archaeon]